MPSRGRRLLALLACVTVSASCGHDAGPPSSPSGRLSISGLSPSSGSTLGGTSVVITGGGFAEGAGVTFGGVAAAATTLSGAGALTAVAPQHAAGSVDVAVAVGGSRAVVPGAFTYVPPTQAANAPPRILSIQVTNRNGATPRGVANLADAFDVRAVVEDDETPVSDLQMTWSASVGAISGSSATATWTAPASVASALTAQIALTVTEVYSGLDSQGLPVRLEQKVSNSVAVPVHDLAAELIDLGYVFLEDFSQQRLDPAAVVRNFSDSCRGKGEEYDDVAKNHREEIINSYNISRSPKVTIAPRAVCPYYAPERNRVGDGCAWFPVVWRSTLKEDGSQIYQEGFDQVNAIFEGGNWKLCDSDWLATIRRRNGLPTNRRFRK